MLRYILRRLVGAAITLVIVLSIVFVLLRQMPIEGYFENYDKLSPAVINARLNSLGLNDPASSPRRLPCPFCWGFCPWRWP